MIAWGALVAKFYVGVQAAALTLGTGGGGGAWPWPGTERLAASASLSDVQAAVNAAVDGDWISIPNGSATWTSGISTSKQIGIVARNYTPTSGGTMTRSVTITNNSPTQPLFSFTTGNSYPVGIGGIRFNDPNISYGNHVRFYGTGSKVPLIFDCAFQNNSRFGTSTETAGISMQSQGGVMWNCYMDGTGFNGDGDPGSGSNGPSIIMKPAGPVWNSASTMGMLDANGDKNFYVEDCSLINVGQNPDVDDNGRLVWRYNTLAGSSGVTHGFSSAVGGRHVEYYNNVVTNPTQGRNISRYFWIRKGTAVFCDNSVASSSTGYTLWSFVSMGENNPASNYGAYPLPKQHGRGWSAGQGDLFLEPIYIWNNTGAMATQIGVDSGWETHIQLNRDYYVGTPKPGYTKFTYPHPARAGVDAGQP